jgi:hypothetical protein
MEGAVGEIGNKRVGGHRLHMSTVELPVLVFNPHVSLTQTAEAQRPKVDVPESVIDLLQADVFADRRWRR